jgi:hypothetical protein
MASSAAHIQACQATLARILALRPALHRISDRKMNQLVAMIDRVVRDATAAGWSQDRIVNYLDNL